MTGPRTDPAFPGAGRPALRRRRPGHGDGEFPGHERFCSADPFGSRLEFLEPRAG